MRLVPDISLGINSSINRGVWFTMPFTLDIEQADLTRYYYLLTLDDISIIKLYNTLETSVIKINSNNIEIIKNVV
jgi:hypothetical protein